MPYVKKELLHKLNSKLSEAKNLIELSVPGDNSTDRLRNRSLKIITEVQNELELLAR